MIGAGQENGQYVLSDSDWRAIVLSFLPTVFATSIICSCTIWEEMEKEEKKEGGEGNTKEGGEGGE